MNRDPREIAYLALLAAKNDHSFIADTLNEWIRCEHPTKRDASLAKEIAYGTCRMRLSLDALALQCTTSGKLSLKSKERLILHMALYQAFYLQRIPMYAITNTALELAKKYCHPRFAKFLNASLRHFAASPPHLPEEDAPQSLSIRFSYPLCFVSSMVDTYGVIQTKTILEAGNLPAKTQFRIRNPAALSDLPSESYQLEDDDMATLLNPDLLDVVGQSPHFYIQNGTPVHLMHALKQRDFFPRRLLDLCASPGGKLLLAHDFFPKAELHANDISPEKLVRLKENMEKYAITASYTCGLGENFSSHDQFDLIILDVPCSNTGVLNKRPEARWRLSPDQMEEIEQTQRLLLKQASHLLSPQGEIWYLTCSISPEENEQMIDFAQTNLSLASSFQTTILPTPHGNDGGFACTFRRP